MTGNRASLIFYLALCLNMNNLTKVGGKQRHCYTCFTDETGKAKPENRTEPPLDAIPEFDVQNMPTQNHTYPPCAFHTNVTCNETEINCYVELTYLDDDIPMLTKGCTADPVGCTPKESNGHQICVCAKRLCNADLTALGGDYVEALYDVSRGVTRTMSYGNFLWLAICVLILVLSWRCGVSGLECCKGKFELKEADRVTDEEEETEQHKSSCTNKGNTCFNVGCNHNSCSIKDRDFDTDCKQKETCKDADSFCRLLYYDNTENVGEANSPELVTMHYTVQGCASLEEDVDAKVGCEMFNKIFYHAPSSRMTLQKDCYCKEPVEVEVKGKLVTVPCNQDLKTACMSVGEISEEAESCSKAFKASQASIVAYFVIASATIIISTALIKS